jgi:hypothetical protein
MKTRGEIEAAICEGITRFEHRLSIAAHAAPTAGQMILE